MAHARAAVDGVVVASSDALASHVAGLSEVADDALRRSLGDTHGLSYVTQAHVRVALKAEEHLSMTRNEVPAL